MSPPRLGLLCALALAACFAVRAWRLWRWLDPKARRALLVRGAAFAGLGGAGAGLLAAWAGSLALPLAWTLLLAAGSAALLLEFLRRA